MRAWIVAVAGILFLSSSPEARAGWGPWTKMGGNFTYDPAICTEYFTFTRAHVAARGADRAIWMRTWNGTSWSAAFSLGGTWKSSPALVCTADRLDVFAWGLDNNINYNTFIRATGRWSGWRPIAVGWVNSGPAAVYRGANSMTVFARGYGNTLKATTSTFDRWSPWFDYGGDFRGDPSAAITFFTRGWYIKVVVRAPDTLAWMLEILPYSDFRWTNLHRNTYGDPDITMDVPSRSSRTDIFTTNPRRTLDHWWGTWESLGGSMAGYSGAAGVWTKQNQLLVVVRGTDNALHHRVFNR